MQLKIGKGLLPNGPLHAYDDGGKRKEAFHTSGRAFVRGLAKHLSLPKGTFEIRSNKAGIAVSGEVTLHHDKLHLWLEEDLFNPGKVVITYRSCRGRRDCSGGRNHSELVVNLFNTALEERFLNTCRELMEVYRA
jgi:hypothetical protein